MFLSWSSFLDQDRVAFKQNTSSFMADHILVRHQYWFTFNFLGYPEQTHFFLNYKLKDVLHWNNIEWTDRLVKCSSYLPALSREHDA